MDGADGRGARAGGGGGASRKRARVATASGEEDTEPLTAVTAAYAGVDGYGIARDEKRRQRVSGVYAEGIQYGEVEARAFAYALTWVAAAKDGEDKARHFVDLGSGVGKAVLTAAATGGFASVTGVELLRPLHEAAVAALAKCDVAALRGTKVAFECGDALRYDWSSMDVTFVSLTCFTEEQVARVAEGATRLKKGARMIVTSRTLETPALRMLRKEKIAYGKGTLTFIAYERV